MANKKIVNGVLLDMTPEEIEARNAEIIANASARQTEDNAIVIKNLKKQLADTDYKVIKCYEYSLTGKEQPYNIIELNEQRDAIRQQINGLENA